MSVKRSFDIIFSFLGLFFLSPILVLVGAWVLLESPGGVFFRQERVGRHGEIFKIFKFRTMKVDSEKGGRLTVGNDSRITRSGHFLRKYKVDELPQLIDVFRGKMSLVGPRPEVKEFIDEYPPKVKQKVLSVRPGITDLASIEMVDENEILAKYPDARTAYIEQILPIKQKYYVDYIDNRNTILDLKIIFRTISKIVSR